MTEAFGICAMAGKSTAFIGPMLVATVAALTGSPRAGVSLIVVLFLPSLVLLLLSSKKLASA
jgi:UMF1 family MFS transporter